MNNKLITLLNTKAAQYESPDFIADDPITIPHRFTRKQDIEIAGFFAAVLAWGNRKSIINSCHRLLAAMDHAPYDFIMQHQEQDLVTLNRFVHRTFNSIDLFHFIDFLKYHYGVLKNTSLETAFFPVADMNTGAVEAGLIRFNDYFFDRSIFPHFEKRTQKHIASPLKKSACKRLNMFLRWMVRDNKNGVDFGIWKHITPAQLICPLDLHVARVARHFQLLQRPANDWLSATELTNHLRVLDPADPVKYDYALFGLGVVERF